MASARALKVVINFTFPPTRHWKARTEKDTSYI